MSLEITFFFRRYINVGKKREEFWYRIGGNCRMARSAPQIEPVIQFLERSQLGVILWGYASTRKIHSRPPAAFHLKGRLQTNTQWLSSRLSQINYLRPSAKLGSIPQSFQPRATKIHARKRTFPALKDESIGTVYANQSAEELHREKHKGKKR